LYERTAEIPFSSDSKWMAVQCVPRSTADGEAGAGPWYYVKGAAEALLERCTTYVLVNGATAALSSDARRMFADIESEVRAAPSQA
jgi:magnesium-transporting ATPase (P-type)